jgi:zinc transport system substrate-binding protein
MSSFPRRLILALLLLVVVMVPARAGAAPKVLASIKPLQSLAANVMDGIGEPALLMRATASPHTYTLRPSDARAIAGADLIFWIGPGYESFMAKAVRSLPRHARVVTMSRIPAIRLLPVREGGVWAAHDEAGHEATHGHDQATEQDMHLWLDTDNAKAMAQAMAAALAEADPAHAEQYRGNAAGLAERLDRLDAELRTRLAPVADRPFIVFHDAYQYLERRYGLAAAGSITVTPDRVPGPRRISELRRAVVERKAACVFSEPQFTSSLVATVAEDTQARSGILDVLGAAAPDGKEGYFAMMRALASSLVTCLSR